MTGEDEPVAVALAAVLTILLVAACLYQWNFGKHFYVDLSCGPTYSEPCS